MLMTIYYESEDLFFMDLDTKTSSFVSNLEVPLPAGIAKEEPKQLRRLPWPLQKIA